MTLVAFTGSRHELPAAQVAALARVLRDIAPSRVAHGCATGGDEVAHRIARALGAAVDHHPGVGAGGDRTWRGECDVLRGDVVWPEVGHLERNAALLVGASALVACPREERGESGGGTWWTTRRARVRGVPVVIVRPSGRVDRETTR